MCQMSVFMEQNGKEELLLEDVTTLTVSENGVRISTLFEGPKEVAGAIVRSIDFMAGKVLLSDGAEGTTAET